jgi:hypothetical protein
MFTVHFRGGPSASPPYPLFCPACPPARTLDMSVRWVKHLKKAVREQGDGAGAYIGGS